MLPCPDRSSPRSRRSAASPRPTGAARPSIPEPLEPLLTLNDLAALSRLSIRTLQRQIAAGQLQAVRLGRRVRFRRADVDAWIAGAIR